MRQLKRQQTNITKETNENNINRIYTTPTPHIYDKD